MALTKEQLEYAWKIYSKKHIIGGNLLEIAFGLREPTKDEVKHLGKCSRCYKWFIRYLKSK